MSHIELKDGEKNLRTVEIFINFVSKNATSFS